MNDSPRVIGVIGLEVYRKGKLIHQDEVRNGMATLGLNNMLDCMFRGATQSASWYILLISNNGYLEVKSTDTMASHTGWTECVDYSETTRPAWTPSVAANRSITNPVNTTFTINADDVEVVGVGITSSDVKGGTAGLLWSTGLFQSMPTFITDDVVKIKYSVVLNT